MNQKTIWEDEEGFGTLEMVLIIVVLIAFVLLFKNQIQELLNTIFEKINSNARDIYGK
ncbi:MAG: Flp1 family type IVb pilin [Lachnospiraceae bacterium]